MSETLREKLRKVAETHGPELMVGIIVVFIVTYLLAGMGWSPSGSATLGKFVVYLSDDNTLNQVALHWADGIAEDLELNYVTSTTPPPFDRYYLPMIYLALDVNNNPNFQKVYSILKPRGAITETNNGYIIVGWPGKLYDKSKPQVSATIGGSLANQTAMLLEYTVPNLSVTYVQSPYLLYVKGPQEVLDQVKQLLGSAPYEIQGDTLILPKFDKVRIDLFVMSFCPFGNKEEEALYKVKQLLGNAIEIVPHFIYYPGMQAQACVDQNRVICSMHGAWEARQDLRESCIYHLYGGDTWLEYASKVDAKCNASSIDSCWEEVAREMGLDVNAIKACDGTALALQDLQLTQSLGISASPTILIAGFYGPLTGYRDAETLKTLICSFLKNPPPGCSQAIQETTNVSGRCG